MSYQKFTADKTGADVFSVNASVRLSARVCPLLIKVKLNTAWYVQVPAMQPCDCCTWWNHSDGKYSISPAFTLQWSGRARRYCGNRSRSGFSGSRGIHGTWEGESWRCVV